MQTPKIQVTAEAVKAAYDRHPEIKPVDGKFYSTKDDQCGVCGLSILAIDIVGLDYFLERKRENGDFFHLFEELYGWNSEQLWSFINGFDGIPESRSRDVEIHKIGAEARKLVFGDEESNVN